MSFFNQLKSSFYEDNSILSINELVNWKKTRNAYNFETLPEVAIITINKKSFSKYLNLFKKKIKGIHGEHYIYNSKFLFCSEFGMGSSAIITLLEELKELGVQRFVFIGVAGILDSSIKENDAYCISSVFSSTGSSYFYTEDQKINNFDLDWFNQIMENCSLKSKISWSTDCPFRETKPLIDYYKLQNCSLVDMETAGLYAFSTFYKVPAVSILIGADNISKKWKAPNNYKLLLKKQQSLISKVIKS
ncbi:phosphorylase family protein [Urechidicola croceus]|uniref:Nucleoside phosphorylase domain-containing protein n=1 Tax=Urechidicola croceus TaxID=1850246 RepID=A0A1D8PAD3_9FLAO|nr:hypothetical protein [Urechidicola croceus]AOW21471.1 hypothetical protein LPB138_12620 [Urechidicola croceus]